MEGLGGREERGLAAGRVVGLRCELVKILTLLTTTERRSYC